MSDAQTTHPESTDHPDTPKDQSPSPAARAATSTKSPEPKATEKQPKAETTAERPQPKISSTTTTPKELSKPATVTPMSANIKPPIPSPAAFAHHPAVYIVPASGTQFSQADLDKAKNFGRVDDNGNVFVKDGDGEREVGQFPDSSPDDALTLYARRYLELKAKLDHFATRLLSADIKPREIDETLRSLKEESENPKVVGDISELRTQLDTLVTKANDKKMALAKEHQQEVEKAIQEREKIVERAEAIAAGISDKTNWASTSEEFRTLFERWQEHQRTSVYIDKKHADALWKRFTKARSTFNQARRKWQKNRDQERREAKVTKEAIIREAESLANSTEWVETSRKFNELMDRWKKAGRAGRTDDDELWSRFRNAADAFFNARQSDRDKINASEQENLAKKEELLTKAEALLPVKNPEAAKRARKALADIQEQWDSIGYVPRQDKPRIERRLDAVDDQIKQVEEAAWKQEDPEADARKSSFQQQLESQLSELDAKIRQEKDAKKKAALTAERATKEQWLNAVK